MTKQLVVPRELQGIQRLRVELGGDEKELNTYSAKWESLVLRIAATVEEKMKGSGKELERSFITEIWKAIKKARIKFVELDDESLHHALRKLEFDCDNSAILVLDVAKVLGIPTQFVYVPNHSLVKTENFYFETTSGRYGELHKLPGRYPIRQILGEDQILSIAYFNLGNAYASQHRPLLSVEAYEQAIALNPHFLDAYLNLAISYKKLGMFEKEHRIRARAHILSHMLQSA